MEIPQPVQRNRQRDDGRNTTNLLAQGLGMLMPIKVANRWHEREGL